MKQKTSKKYSGHKFRLTEEVLARILKISTVFICAMVIVSIVYSNNQKKLANNEGLKPQSAAAISGNVRVAVIVLSNNQNPTLIDQLYQKTFGAQNSIASYFARTSYGNLSISGDVFGPFPHSFSSSTPCGTENAYAVSQLGNQSSNYNTFITFTPEISNCTGSKAAGPGVNALASITGFNYLAIHELGHESIFSSLGHASQLNNCVTTSNNIILPKTGCTVTEYGDASDPMGSSITGYIPDFQAYNKAKLGWLSSDYVDNSEIYDLSASEQSSGTRLLHIPGSTYFLELRNDTSLPSSYTGGVLLRQSGRFAGEGTTAILTKLMTGQTFNDPAKRIWIKVFSVNGGNARVYVSLNNQRPPASDTDGDEGSPDDSSNEIPTVSLWSNPNTVNSGGSSMLSWESENTTSCGSISKSGTTSALSTSGRTSGSISTGTLTNTGQSAIPVTYSLTCSNARTNTTIYINPLTSQAVTADLKGKLTGSNYAFQDSSIAVQVGQSVTLSYSCSSGNSAELINDSGNQLEGLNTQNQFNVAARDIELASEIKSSENKLAFMSWIQRLLQPNASTPATTQTTNAETTQKLAGLSGQTRIPQNNHLVYNNPGTKTYRLRCIKNGAVAANDRFTVIIQ